MVKANGHINGTLYEQVILKEGADFLKELMSRLTDEQIKGMFEAGMVELAPGGSKRVVVEGTTYRIVDRAEGGRTVADWVKAFKYKMQRDVLEHRCGT